MSGEIQMICIPIYQRAIFNRKFAMMCCFIQFVFYYYSYQQTYFQQQRVPTDKYFYDNLTGTLSMVPQD